MAITTAPALKPIDYDSTGKVILEVDASNEGWDAVVYLLAGRTIVAFITLSRKSYLQYTENLIKPD